jgi:aldehyde:ferredoxin oxidoreductase
MATPRKTDGKKQLVTNQACFGCTIACGRISKMDETTSPSRTSRSTGVPAAAWNTKPPGRWARPTASTTWKRCNTPTCCATKQGIDPISFGATIGAVMELYAMGVLTKEHWVSKPRSARPAGAGELAEKPPMAVALARKSARVPSA